MSNKQNEVETSSTRTTTPFELFDTITEKNNALRAFGALLRSANLSDFDSENYVPDKKSEADSLQWGLSGLIDLFLADQEQTVENFADEYHESDEWMIRSVSDSIKLVEEGMWSTGYMPRDHFQTALEKLETVIGRNEIYKPMAEALKASLLKHAPPQVVQNIAQGDGS